DSHWPAQWAKIGVSATRIAERMSIASPAGRRPGHNPGVVQRDAFAAGKARHDSQILNAPAGVEPGSELTYSWPPTHQQSITAMIHRHAPGERCHGIRRCPDVQNLLPGVHAPLS